MAVLPQAPVTSVDEILANAGGGVNIPAGDYTAVIFKSEMKDTKNGGKSLNLTFTITSGQYINTELTERLNLVNDNATAVKIAYETLARIAKAVGLNTLPQDSSLIHNKPLTITVKTEPAKPYIDNNGVQQPGSPRSAIDSRGYRSVPTVNVQLSGATSETGSMPWQS